jgi:hypothetical protein
VQELPEPVPVLLAGRLGSLLSAQLQLQEQAQQSHSPVPLPPQWM